MMRSAISRLVARQSSGTHSLIMSAAAACLAVAFAVRLGYARRQTRSKLIHTLTVIPAISYAVPGAVLAIGFLIPLARLDNGLDAAMRSLFSIPTGLLSGTRFCHRACLHRPLSCRVARCG